MLSATNSHFDIQRTLTKTHGKYKDRCHVQEEPIPGLIAGTTYPETGVMYKREPYKGSSY